jgi:hypothetical protein
VTGRLAAQERARATRQNRRHVVRLHARSPVPDAVHAPKFDEQRATRQAPVDLLRRDPGRQQLGPGNHSMLPPGDPRDYKLKVPTLTPHMGV